jgi:hypothetical protein
MMAWNHPKGMCWYNGDICFIGVPKNASTSFRNSFNIKGSLDNYLNPKNKKIKDLKLVTVIRDPLDRVISGYLETIKRCEKNTINKKFFKMDESKERFIEFLNELEIGFFDCHIEKQCFYMTDNNNNLLPFDLIIDLGEFGSSVKKLNKNPTRTNVSQIDKKKMVKDYLDDTLISRINTIYKEDFELYKKFKNGNI